MTKKGISAAELKILGELEKKVLWLSSWTIHHANHIRESTDGLKVGDAEMDEGNIFESMLEGWKQGLRNCWWIIDYNRQSLDAVIREGLWSRYEALFKAFGWDVVIVKHGALQEAAFKEPGGEALRGWIDSCPNQLYSALTVQGCAAWRKRLTDELGDQGA